MGIDAISFENINQNYNSNREIWISAGILYIYRFNQKQETWDRLTHNYTCINPALSNDGKSMVYLAYDSNDNDGRPDGYKHIFSRSDGQFRIEIEAGIDLKYFDFAKEIVSSYDHSWCVKSSLNYIREEDNNGEATYYYATPFLINRSGSRDYKSEWKVIKISFDKEILNKIIEADMYISYRINCSEVDLDIPFSEFDHILDLRFRSDGRYVSLVGAKNGIRKLYIFDLEKEELREVEGSEGAITARWLEDFE